ncbi:chemotaxis protein [Gluconacetobacter azotocaptans]|uniref:Chemotaxis protein n=1 Tax=Gluconacetobacter azotocaptans TaxID=142834 RepID=A0A7W4JR78_9PROT|nr:rod-binding protein [Gluconacetobacter azotocaptans]MBB2189437.1 chemotaxis protein [Gluconacetobacter azotocaptans]MBM9401168.1 rod-binding protein [Gluconacetobacter azotocaptans]GBQ34607.1 chemotactic signal-response protein CheL [Gluconacetobacter azotocaptans DSM 13594]
MSVGSITGALSSVGQHLSSAQSDTGTSVVEKARKAAVEFEGMTIGELLQPMFDTADTSEGMFGGGAAEQQFRSLQVLEMGKQIANNGGIGLSDSIYRQMLAMQEKAQS